MTHEIDNKRLEELSEALPPPTDALADEVEPQERE